MRWFREIKPAAENTRSALAEPLGILYILRATFARRGKDLELAFQNPMTSLTSSGFNRGDERKLSTSLFTSHSPASCFSEKYDPNMRGRLITPGAAGAVDDSPPSRGRAAAAADAHVAAGRAAGVHAVAISSVSQCRVQCTERRRRGLERWGVPLWSAPTHLKIHSALT